MRTHEEVEELELDTQDPRALEQIARDWFSSSLDMFVFVDFSTKALSVAGERVKTARGVGDAEQYEAYLRVRNYIVDEIRVFVGNEPFSEDFQSVQPGANRV